MIPVLVDSDPDGEIRGGSTAGNETPGSRRCLELTTGSTAVGLLAMNRDSVGSFDDIDFLGVLAVVLPGRHLLVALGTRLLVIG